VVKAGGDVEPRVSAEGVKDDVLAALSEVSDPEIPPCSITDLGLVQRVAVTEDAVEVDLLPTFAGCPALDVIREDATAAVASVAHGRQVKVRFVYSPPWTSDRISERGHAALRAYGVTPPTGARAAGPISLALLRRVTDRVRCPFCGGEDTVVESAFGPTLCRSTHFCRSCRNPFEGFKTKGSAWATRSGRAWGEESVPGKEAPSAGLPGASYGHAAEAGAHSN
jgi:ring-1,2-phenylacetyl-CoA epoxidase subunit PaaD